MEVGPAAFAAMGAELASGVEAAGFAFTHGSLLCCEGRGGRSLVLDLEKSMSRNLVWRASWGKRGSSLRRVLRKGGL